MGAVSNCLTVEGWLKTQVLAGCCSCMISTDRFEKVEVNDAAALRAWLSQHHSREEGIWLVTYKKVVPEKYVSREEVLDELLCFGWIDGIRRKLDEERTMQLITPRRVEHWTKTYKERAARLIEKGKMEEPGQQSIEASKRNGLWNFMDDVDALIVPPDLQTALELVEGASDFFAGINPSSKRNTLRWIKLAKTDKTRNKRIVEIARLSGKGEKLKGT